MKHKDKQTKDMNKALAQHLHMPSPRNKSTAQSTYRMRYYVLCLSSLYTILPFHFKSMKLESPDIDYGPFEHCGQAGHRHPRTYMMSDKDKCKR